MKVLAQCSECGEEFLMDEIEEIVEIDENGSEFVRCYDDICQDCWRGIFEN